MSKTIVEAVLRLSPASKIDLLCEIVLAFFSDNHGIVENRGIHELAAVAKMSRRHFLSCIAHLEEGGEIYVHRSPGRPNRYHLMVATRLHA